MAARPFGRRSYRIVSVVGTRPEAIKMGPVARALAARRGFEQEIVLTGQHRGLAEMFGGMAVRELRYDPSGRTPARLRETLHAMLCGHFQSQPADLILVQGDTASALAGAFAARDCNMALGHVEAGLRSFDLAQPWPEEGNRVAIDAMSDILFAPTQAAAANLAADWRVRGAVYVTGNTGIDALLAARDESESGGGALRDRKTILVTCHRKENRGEPARSVCAALERLAADLPVDIVVLLHPNRHVRQEMEGLLKGSPHIALREPVEHRDMVRLMDRSWLILTDSGGLQEEGPALGKPVLVLRNVTERGEALACGNIALVGTAEDHIVAAVSSLFHDAEKYARMARPSLPFGDGRAAPRIVAAIEAWLNSARIAA